MITKATTWQKGMRILCALALFAIGFAHRVPVAEAGFAGTEISAYMLPDGSLPDLCHTFDHDDGQSHPDRHAVVPVCEVCRIVAGILLPQPADMTGMPLLIETGEGFVADTAAFRPSVLLMSAAPRAPPLSA